MQKSQNLVWVFALGIKLILRNNITSEEINQHTNCIRVLCHRQSVQY